jgi:hypothetical protein
MSFLDKMNLIEYEHTLKQKIRMFQFLSMIKLQVSEDFKSDNFLNYKKKIFQVSDKIDKWHEKLYIQKDDT